MKVQVLTIRQPGQDDVVTLFASNLTEGRVVALVAGDFECLLEKQPQSLAELNDCVPGVKFTLTTEEVIDRWSA
jgi:hypothetical protein